MARSSKERAEAARGKPRSSRSSQLGPVKARVRDSARPKRLSRGEDRGRQVVRLLTLLRAIENSHRGLSIQHLHDVVDRECSLRTIYRDVQHLAQAGFPIEESDGVWRLTAAGKSLVSEDFNATDALAILLSQALWEPLGSFGPARVLADLRQRLAARLKPEGRAFVDELGQRVRATVAAPAFLHEHAEVLDAVDEATDKEQLLRIAYFTPGKGEALRTVEPHLLWLQPGRAYLVAYCRLTHEFRAFAIQRIKSAEVLDETFERREDFDARAYIERPFGVFQGPEYDVVVEFQPSVAHLAHERRWHPTATVDALDNGCVRLAFRAAGLPEIAAWVASFGGKVVPVAPGELRERVRDLHQAGLAALPRI